MSKCGEKKTDMTIYLANSKDAPIGTATPNDYIGPAIRTFAIQSCSMKNDDKTFYGENSDEKMKSMSSEGAPTLDSEFDRNDEIRNEEQCIVRKETRICKKRTEELEQELEIAYSLYESIERLDGRQRNRQVIWERLEYLFIKIQTLVDKMPILRVQPLLVINKSI